MRMQSIAGQARHLWGWRPPYPHQVRQAAASHLGGAEPGTPESKGFAVATRSDLSGIMPDVYDQGSIGSCVMNALLECFEAARAKNGLPRVEYSREFAYAVVREKVMKVPLSEDSGTTITDGVTALFGWGVCNEGLWPYLPANFDVEPPLRAWQDAMAHRVLRAYWLSDTAWIKACLTLGYPVSIGVSLPASFISDTAHTGQMHYPGPSESFIGGHAMAIIGHDDEHDNGPDEPPGAFFMRNSWSISFGLNGNCWMGYRWVDTWLALEARTIHETTAAA